MRYDGVFSEKNLRSRACPFSNNKKKQMWLEQWPSGKSSDLIVVNHGFELSESGALLYVNFITTAVKNGEG